MIFDTWWGKALVSALVVVISGALFWALSHILQTVARRAGVRPATLRAGRDIIRVLWIIVAVAGVIYVTGLASALTILTISGIAGLVVSLSLQAFFSNLVAGVLLVQDGAVGVGDEIEFGSVRGRVIRLTLRNTWVAMDSSRVAIISNSQLMSGPLINHTKSPRFLRETQD
jgi:small conductance mechanosensitive channel